MFQMIIANDIAKKGKRFTYSHEWLAIAIQAVPINHTERAYMTIYEYTRLFLQPVYAKV